MMLKYHTVFLQTYKDVHYFLHFVVWYFCVSVLHTTYIFISGEWALICNSYRRLVV